MKIYRKAMMGLASVVLLNGRSLAADDDTLVRVLTSADMAHNFAVYCSQYDRSIIGRTRSKIGDVRDLMLHVRSEVISGLPNTEASEIVVRAANVARAVALLEVRKHYDADPNDERTRLTAWCESTALPRIKEFVSWHDDNHSEFEAPIRKAKERNGGVPPPD